MGDAIIWSFNAPAVHATSVDALPRVLAVAGAAAAPIAVDVAIVVDVAPEVGASLAVPDDFFPLPAVSLEFVTVVASPLALLVAAAVAVPIADDEVTTATGAGSAPSTVIPPPRGPHPLIALPIAKTATTAPVIRLDRATCAVRTIRSLPSPPACRQ